MPLQELLKNTAVEVTVHRKCTLRSGIPCCDARTGTLPSESDSSLYNHALIKLQVCHDYVVLKTASCHESWGRLRDRLKSELTCWSASYNRSQPVIGCWRSELLVALLVASLGLTTAARAVDVTSTGNCSSARTYDSVPIRSGVDFLAGTPSGSDQKPAKTAHVDACRSLDYGQFDRFQLRNQQTETAEIASADRSSDSGLVPWTPLRSKEH